MPESPLHSSFKDERGSSSEWGPILAFIVLANAVTWLACLLLRSTFAAGHLWAFFTFLFVTVWSPTAIALALSSSFEGSSGVRNLLGFLFRGFSKNNLWYLTGILVPVTAVASAIVIARRLHAGAAFIPLAALPLTLGLQVLTGAMGEELGWRGFLLSHLERRLSPRVAASIMAITWHSGTFQLSFSRSAATARASHRVPPHGCCVRHFLSLALQPHERPRREHNAGALLLHEHCRRGSNPRFGLELDSGFHLLGRCDLRNRQALGTAHPHSRSG